MEIAINRNDTALLKGIAIVAIVFHNFCHWIPGAVIENEYNFRVENAYRLVDVLLAGGPHVVMNLFSHLGCYGVPVSFSSAATGWCASTSPHYPEHRLRTAQPGRGSSYATTR